MLAAIGDAAAGVLSSPIVTGILLATGVTLVVVWLAGTWWAYLDISRRTTSELARFGAMALVIVSTPLLLPLSLVVYSLVRPQTTSAERRAAELAGGLGPTLAGRARCSACHDVVDPDWRRCPSCATWLASPCDACGEWSEGAFDVCPWCAAAKVDRVPSAPQRQPTVVAARPARAKPARTGRSRRHRRAPAPIRIRRSGVSVEHGGPVEAAS
ncbi:MAG: hypothetical protein ACAH65_05925 [Chloroflexota bacterium]